MQDQVTTDEAANLTGRAQVRALLVTPLVQAGLCRAPGVTVAAHDAFLARLVERLAYLDAGALNTLCEVVLGVAEGKLHNQWPGFATVWNMCQRISRQPPPDEERHIMTTWLRSRGGPLAQAGGYLVELYGYLRRTGSPPNDFVLGRIKEEGAENARQLARLQDKIARGVASPSEADWVARYLDQAAYCAALVAGGERARQDREIASEDIASLGHSGADGAAA